MARQIAPDSGGLRRSPVKQRARETATAALLKSPDENLNLIDELLERRQRLVEDDAREYARFKGMIGPAPEATELGTVAALILLDREARHTESELAWIRDTRQAHKEYRTRPAPGARPAGRLAGSTSG